MDLGRRGLGPEQRTILSWALVKGFVEVTILGACSK